MATKLYLWMYPGCPTMPQEMNSDDVSNYIQYEVWYEIIQNPFPNFSGTFSGG